ncbi:endonuclease 8-like 1 isoform X1 [Passer montanus]|uniref:endonuclease 8-like 1 isoform X1 n=1 Tax=Passer montanus TaxID=9160 RepID=UPI001961FD99|nr:endonuclease 8-like 1 isoform X1 [Passer montanus]
MGAGRAAGGGGGLGLRRAAATMPECPELHLAGRFINGACGALVFAGGVERSAVGRGPEVPFRSEAYGISAVARGKELRLTLSALDRAAGPPAQDLVFRFGMSGSFRLCPAAELPRHAHLRFLTRESPPRALCFVDPRRFGSWRLGDAWQPERGPCVVSEYQAFRENVLKNLDDRAFDKPICEVLLNQKYFNGIGNYLRAEILYRLKIPPFEKARTVLEALKEQEQERRKKDPSLTLSKKVKLRQENPDLLELCHSVPMEVIMAEKQLLDPEHPDYYATFKNWLQCYLVPGMSSLRDRNGRTIWFQGEPGPMAPKGQRPRKTPRKKSPQLKAEPEAASPEVTPRASKQRRRAAAKPLKSEEKEEEEQEEQADGPRKGRARGRRTVAAAPASPEVPQSVRRSRRISAHRGRGAAPAV